MKQLAIATLLIISCVAAWAADFDKGTAAYNSGDYATATAEWKSLAEQGYASAQYILGLMYDKGEGVIKDVKEAVKWYRLAAEQGHVRAQYILGLMYGLGDGVIQDNVYAHMWSNLAAANGDEDARTLKDSLVKQMTPQDIYKAQDAARECVKKNYKDC